MPENPNRLHTMKSKLLVLLLPIAALIALPQIQASASKNNVGSSVGKLKLDFPGKDPEIQGKPYILEFWATWCPPCRTSIPHLNEVYEKFKGKGLEVIGVTDEDKGTVEAFTKKIPIRYHVGYDNGGRLSKSFGVRGIPHAMIVNKEGKIVWEGHPMSLPESQLEEVLK